MFGEHIREFQKYMVFGILDDNGLSKGPMNDTNVRATWLCLQRGGNSIWECDLYYQVRGCHLAF